VIASCYRSPISVVIDSLNEQGHALRLHFEAVIAAVELPVASEREVKEPD
jgi:hypothetical protein